MIKKGDFVNVIFENVRGIQASELLNFLNLFTASFDDVISYDEFLKLLYRIGSGELQGGSALGHYQHEHIPHQQDLALLEHNMGHINVNDGYTPNQIVLKLKPQERELVEKVRASLKGQAIEEVLRRFAGQGSEITDEDILIGVSKLNANLYLADLKEFINIVKSASGNPSDNKISLSDALQLMVGSNTPL